MKALRIVLLTLFLSDCYLLADQCQDILNKGIFDFSESSSIEKSVSSYVHWLRQQKFSSEEETKSASAGLGIKFPIEDIPIGLKADYNQLGKSNRTWSEDFADFVEEHSDLYKSFTSKFQTVNQGIVDAWKNCMTEKTGLIAWCELTSDSNEILLHLRFRVTDPNVVNVKLDKIDPPSGWGTSVDYKGRVVPIGLQDLPIPFRRTRRVVGSLGPFVIFTDHANYNASCSAQSSELSLPTIEAHWTVTDKLPHTYEFTFICVKDPDGKVWISLNEPSGGLLDGHNYDFYLSNARQEVQIPIPRGAGVYAFGKLSLVPDVDQKKTYIYFDGGLHTTDGTERSINHSAVGSVSGVLAL